MSEFMNHAVEACVTPSKNIILVTRCGCRKIEKIQASVIPQAIQIELDVPEGYPQTVRRFTYVGENRVDGNAVYQEDLPAIDVIEGEVLEAKKEESHE